jgi:MFS transporter, DHA2 family, multidrug resistance protein
MTAAAEPSREVNRGLISISVMLATVIQALDTTIANVALPNMQGSLSATLDQVSWVLTSYIVAAAIMTPPTGYLASRFGRKRVFLACVAGFTITSMLCGAATSLPEIVVFRFLQGACGAGLVPLSQSVLLDSYPREKHGHAMAMWGVGVMVGPIIGPTLGGWLTDAYSWRWVFYINLPIGILAFLGLAAFIPENARDRARPFDWFGFVLLSVAIGGMQMMLDRGQSQDWFSSAEIVVEAVIACLFLYMFVVHMFTAEHPFVEPALFRDRNFAVGQVFIFVIGVLLLATMALLPPFLQNLLDYPVLAAGWVMMPRGMGTMVAMFIVGKLVGKVNARALIVFGMALTATSLWEMSQFDMNVGAWPIIWSAIMQGAGFGFIFVPLSTLTFVTLAPKYRTEGSSMYSLLRNLGSSIGVSIVIAQLAQNTQANHAAIAETLTPYRDALNPAILPHAWNWTTQAGAMALNAEVTRQAATIAYIDDYRLLMWVMVLALPLVLLLRPPRRPAPIPDEVIDEGMATADF